MKVVDMQGGGVLKLASPLIFRVRDCVRNVAWHLKLGVLNIRELSDGCSACVVHVGCSTKSSDRHIRR